MRDISLTPEDREVLLGYADHLEHRNCYWKLILWMSLVLLAIGLVSMVLIQRYFFDYMSGVISLPEEALKVPADADSQSIQNAIDGSALLLEMKIHAARAEFMAYLLAFITGLKGAGFCAYSMYLRKRRNQDESLARLLRFLVAVKDDPEVRHEE